MGSQKFTRLLVLPIYAKKKPQANPMLANWSAFCLCNGSKWCSYSLERVSCFRPLLWNNALCVWSNHWDFLHLSSPCLPAQTQPRFGFGACKGQPAPNLCSDTKIAAATLLVFFSLAGCCHYCDSLCSFPLGNDWFTWWFEVKEATPDFWCYKCSGKWTGFYLPSAGSFSLDSLCR